MANMIWAVLNLFIIANCIKSIKLNGRVALVTGGSRGIGLGISKALALEGFTVYVTARSDTNDRITEKGLGGSLDELVNSVDSQSSGKIIGCKCDHRVDEEIQSVIKTIESNHGRLDILINNAFMVPSNENDSDLLFRNFWEAGQGAEFWDSVINVGLRSHYMTSHFAIPLMNKTSCDANTKNPIIVHISSFGGVSYSFNVAYGVGKCGVDRLAKDMAKELIPFNISCISLYPGVVRTERMVSILDSGEWQRRTGLYTPPEFVESPLLTGRVISALYDQQDNFSMSNNDLIRKNNGNVMVVAETAKKLNIRDINGNIPPSIRSTRFLIPGVILGKYKNSLPAPVSNFLLKYSPDILLPFSFMAGGAPDQ